MSAAKCLTCGRTFMSGTAYLHPAHMCARTNKDKDMLESLRIVRQVVANIVDELDKAGVTVVTVDDLRKIIEHCDRQLERKS